MGKLRGAKMACLGHEKEVGPISPPSLHNPLAIVNLAPRMNKTETTALNAPKKMGGVLVMPFDEQPLPVSSPVKKNNVVHLQTTVWV